MSTTRGAQRDEHDMMSTTRSTRRYEHNDCEEDGDEHVAGSEDNSK